MPSHPQRFSSPKLHKILIGGVNSKLGGEFFLLFNGFCKYFFYFNDYYFKNSPWKPIYLGMPPKSF